MVGIAQDMKGNVYFTDWVSKDYNLHKQGRIWTLKPVGAQRIANFTTTNAILVWTESHNPKLDSADPFERHAAQDYVARVAEWVRSKSLREVSSGVERAEWAVAIRRKTPEDAARRIPELLNDPDWKVRFVAIEWIGEEKLKDFEAALRDNLQKHSSRREEMEATLVALRMLAGEETNTQDEQGADEIVLKMVRDESLAPETRARALRYLNPNHPRLLLEMLKKQQNTESLDLKLEIVRTMRERPEEEAADRLRKVAENEKAKPELRAEATASLDANAAASRSALERLTRDADPVVAEEAKRKLRKPESIEAWSGESVLQAIQEGKAALGDTARGSRYFFTSDQKCSRCHTYDGRGASVGPDLTRIAENRDAAKIAESILHPSKEIAPQFAVVQLLLTSGVTKAGVYIGATPEGKERFVDAEAKVFELDSSEVESRSPMKTSLMPEDISKRMTKEEFLDLVAFLSKK